MTHIHDCPAVHASPLGTPVPGQVQVPSPVQVPVPVPLRVRARPRHLIDSEPPGSRRAEPYEREVRADLALERVWARVAPLLPPPAKRRLTHPGRRPVPDRVALSVVLHVLREGIPWHTARTGELGCSGITAWRRLRRWAQADTWPRIHEAVLDGLDDLDDLDEPARHRAARALGSARTWAHGSTAPAGVSARSTAPAGVSARSAAHSAPAPLAALPERYAPPLSGSGSGEDDDALVAAITRAVAAADDRVLGPLLKRLAGRADTRVVLRLGEALAAAATVGLPEGASRSGQREPASTSVHARSLPETTSPTPTSVNRQSTRS
ncbi:transposase [Streptomyces sp. NPDC047017]|uniref:transposase n=1 Tax=Streptomyces sp. NPDC047017 TaxID=3155024 RepID=UPI0033E167EF